MKAETRVKKLEARAGAAEEQEPFDEIFKTFGVPEEQWEGLERQLRREGFRSQKQFVEWLLNEVDGATRGLPKARTDLDG
ncbi:hypothetical protein SAMN02746065_10918 [Desulfocicer vacuolatum DSM 3385]|uniref:Uncharacterized protein n=1 Tax=Desulfocicer vacuolatum DSM 3385 TaxID=1121400 RepID=A0A1W2BP48_9BACT|nr:hypothetical protein [Desulfocicer vacuolatum]SMC74643.1 hypothetical protein SAMN02746065_10918 [Desulfocicer vacuolatum DSM 3385]